MKGYGSRELTSNSTANQNDYRIFSNCIHSLIKTMSENISRIQLKPGQLIRPELSEQEAGKLIEKLYGVQIKSISEQNSYDDKNYLVLLNERWNNPHIKTLWSHGYVFKVLNSMDSQKKHVEAEHEMEHILMKIGINCPVPELNIHGKEYSMEKIYRKKCNEKEADNEGQPYGLHICRLMKYVPGKIFHAVPYVPSLVFEVGVYTAMIQESLKDFDHPALRNHKTIWSLASLPDLRDFIYVIEDKEHKTLISEILDVFTNEVIPLYSKLKQGVIHGDINEQNIIVSEKAEHGRLSFNQAEHEVYGILDFGDSTYSYYVFDLAIAIMYMSIDNQITDPLLVGGHVLAGYCSKHPLNEFEFDALKVCVAGRYAQSLVLGQYTLSVDPSNDYVVITAKNGWSQLRILWDTPKDELYKKWHSVMNAYKTGC